MMKGYGSLVKQIGRAGRRQRDKPKFFVDFVWKLHQIRVGLSEAQPILESTEFIGHGGGTKDSAYCLCVH
jgi:hypothetical protein